MKMTRAGMDLLYSMKVFEWVVAGCLRQVEWLKSAIEHLDRLTYCFFPFIQTMRRIEVLMMTAKLNRSG